MHRLLCLPSAPRPLAVAVAAMLALLGAGCGLEAEAPLRTAVRIVYPDGVRRADVHLIPSRNDRTIPGWSNSGRAGEHQIEVLGVDVFDLQIGVLPWGLPSGTWDRTIYSVGGYCGFVRGVRAGSTDVVIRAHRMEPFDVTVDVRDAEGRAVHGAKVMLRSYADWVAATTNADGRAVLARVPSREWLADVDPPPAHEDDAEGEGRPLVGATQRVEVRGHTHVRLVLPRGRPIEIASDLRPESPALLVVQEMATGSTLLFNWMPEEPGRMVIHVNPSWKDVHLLVTLRPTDTDNVTEVLARLRVDLNAPGPVRVP